MTTPAELAALESDLLAVPAYSSLPGADATIYLNFAGDSITKWLGYSNVSVPVWSLDEDRTQFSAVELDEIAETWRGVAEDFAPFNINVTTVDPLSDPTDLPIHVTKVNIGGDGSWYGAAGGIAQAGGFSSSTPLAPVLAFAFEQGEFGSFYLKSTISHEAGHTLGLQHQSEWDGDTKVHEYYAGPDDSSGPIMGAGVVAHHSQWWYGTTTRGADVFQNDFDVIAANDRVGLRPDDSGDGIEVASALSPDNDQFVGQGLIGTEDDQDYWSFTAIAGRITVQVETWDHGNLAAHVELLDTDGNVVATSSNGQWGNSQEQDQATITYIASEPGTYYVVVASSGLEAGTTETSHGINVGTYKLTASSAPYSPTELVLSQPSILARPAKVVTLAAGAHLQGTDSAIQSWDQITISIAVGAQTGDLIGVKAAGRGSSRLSVNAKQILKLGRSQIGTLTRVSNGIRIEFSTPQTTDFVEQVVRQLTFKSGRRAAGTRQAGIKIKNTSTNEQVDRAIQIGIA